MIKIKKHKKLLKEMVKEVDVGKEKESNFIWNLIISSSSGHNSLIVLCPSLTPLL
jgi:hypothetical protein